MQPTPHSKATALQALEQAIAADRAASSTLFATYKRGVTVLDIEETYDGADAFTSQSEALAAIRRASAESIRTHERVHAARAALNLAAGVDERG